MPGPVSQSIGVRLIALVLLVLANAFFVAAEFALVAARRTRIDALVRRGDRKAKTVQTALQDLYRQLSAAQLGITVASILLGYVAEDTVAHLFRDWFASLPPALNFLTRGGVASVVAVTLISFLHVVFGEQAPKAWAITYPEATSRSTSRSRRPRIRSPSRGAPATPCTVRRSTTWWVSCTRRTSSRDSARPRAARSAPYCDPRCSCPVPARWRTCSRT